MGDEYDRTLSSLVGDWIRCTEVREDLLYTGTIEGRERGSVAGLKLT